MTIDIYLYLTNSCIYILVAIIGMVNSKDKDKFTEWVLVFICGVTVIPALMASGLILVAICIYIVMDGLPWIISKLLNKKFND